MQRLDSSGPRSLDFDIDGVRRHCLLHVPAARQEGDPAPLVLLFHGGGGSAELALDATGWRELADRGGFVLAAPDALRKAPTRPATFLRNPQFWNVGAKISHAHSQIDDMAFVRAVLERVEEEIAVDPRRVYAAGFSNGASMAMRVGMEMGPRIAAVGAVAGHLWIAPPWPAHPVSLIYIAGRADPMVPFGGGEVFTPWGKQVEMPAVADTVNAWADWIGCRHAVERTAVSDGVQLLRYGPGLRGAGVEFYTIDDMGHVWPGGRPVLAERWTGPATSKLDAAAVFWDFFGRHPRP